MAKIIPVKLVVDLNDNFTVKNAILIYQMDIDGKIEKTKYKTIQVTGGIDLGKLGDIVLSSKDHTEKGEGLK